MTSPWYKVVRRAAMYRFHGFGVQEWTAKKRDDGLVGLKDIEARPQHTIEQWDIDIDGSVLGVWQRSVQTGVMLGIPRSKIVYLVEDTLTDSPEGLGMFRHMADPYQRLKQLQELEIRAYERDLRGIPIARMPLSRLKQAVDQEVITPAEANTMIQGMQDMVTMQVKQSNTGLVLDSIPYFSQAADGEQVSAVPQWGFELLQGGGVGHAEIAAAIDRVQREIARIIGVEHLMMGDVGGNRALAEDKSRNLYLIANSVLKYIASQTEHDVINVLWALNGFPNDKKPTLETEDVTFKNAEAITAALGKMAQAGAPLAPNDPIINDVRDLLGVSRVPDELMEAAMAQPQLPPELAGVIPPQLQLPGRRPGIQGQPGPAGQPRKPPPGGQQPPPPQPTGRKGPPRAKKANGHAKGEEVGKGYPEYRPDQERDESGRWVGGAGGLSFSDTNSAIAELERRLPEYYVDILPMAGGHEVAVGHGANVATFFVPIDKGRYLSFESIYTADDQSGRQFARDILQIIHDSALGSNVNSIRLLAAGAGGYVWPRLGFQLDDANELTAFQEKIENRVAEARNWLSRADFNMLRSAVKLGGLDLPTNLARLDIPLGADAYRAISMGGVGGKKTIAPTLGKALLVGVTGNYTLPKAQFGLLQKWYSRKRAGMDKAKGKVKRIALHDMIFRMMDEEDAAVADLSKAVDSASKTIDDLLKGLPEYREDQPRDDEGRWSGGGGTGSEPGDVLRHGSEARDLLARNERKQGTISNKDFIARLPADQRAFLEDSERKLQGQVSTHATPAQGGFLQENNKWTFERQELHNAIIKSYMERALENARPGEGEQPTVILMGGRGGAGKTSTLNQFDIIPNQANFLYINSDEIKEQLPGYEGWNAGLFHEESSHITDQIERTARDLGLNIIYDATLKTQQTAEDRMDDYEEAGYRIEGYFVHTTPWTSAERATLRGFNAGRYVPPGYVLGSTTNEGTFDAIKGRMDRWAIFDNNGKQPRMAAEGSRTRRTKTRRS
jgi:predicted ABC-type ATPase